MDKEGDGIMYKERKGQLTNTQNDRKKEEAETRRQEEQA